MSLETWLKRQSDRCGDCGYHVKTQGHSSECSEGTRGHQMSRVAEGRRLRESAAAEVTLAYPDDKERVLAAIETTSRRLPEFSVNDMRDLIEGVPASVMGTAFGIASKSGLIEDTSKRAKSDLPGTHAAEVKVWRRAA